MLKRILSIRFALFVLLLLSAAFCAYRIHYKVTYWGFNLNMKARASVWKIEANINFMPVSDEAIKVSMAVPAGGNEFKILGDNVIAEGYKIERLSNGTERIVLKSGPREDMQDIYYQILLYDIGRGKGKTWAAAPKAPEKPLFDEQRLMMAKEIAKKAAALEGDSVQQIIAIFNNETPDTVVSTFLPVNRNQKEMAEAVTSMLSFKSIPNRLIRGVKLEEEKKPSSPDLMLEAYVNDSWRIYDLTTAKKGLPDSFIVFQRGGESLLDVEGGVNSSVQFSAIKSVTSSFGMASHRAKLLGGKDWFEYSIYNLPIPQQNALKWFLAFPLAILIIVVIRNVIGLQTMGTFTPMLLSMALIKTGFWYGLACFSLIIGLGLLIRALLSKLNLLLVPRISAVVIFVVIIIQLLTILGYKFNFSAASAALFFPIIIMAWIIERASITWEEDGPVNAGKEIFNSLIAAVAVYAVVSSSAVRHIMFAFNELNLVILVIVMLLGTYTGYRLTELRRFFPLAHKKKRAKKGA